MYLDIIYIAWDSLKTIALPFLLIGLPNLLENGKTIYEGSPYRNLYVTLIISYPAFVIMKDHLYG